MIELSIVPWLSCAGEVDELRSATDEVLSAVDRQWPAVLDSVPIVRALADAGETGLLARTAESIRETPGVAAHAQTALLAAEGLLALQHGNAGGAVEKLEAAIDRKRQLGRTFDVACLELGLERAREVEPLNCVNPF